MQVSPHIMSTLHYITAEKNTIWLSPTHADGGLEIKYTQLLIFHIMTVEVKSVLKTY